MRALRSLHEIAFVVLASAATLSAQTVETRAELWQRLRVEKAGLLSPPTRTKLESLLVRYQPDVYIDRVLVNGFHGLVPVFGGMQTGSGFVVGALYSKNEFWKRQLDFQATARLSFRLYQQYGARLSAPRLLDERFFVDLETIWLDYTEENFYGIGADSLESNRSNFRDQRFNLTASGGYRPASWLEIGASIGILNTSVASGKSSDYPSIEDVFNPSEVPGLIAQPDYTVTGAFVNVDYTDAPNPRSGGEYYFRFTEYDDRRLDRFSFERFEAELYQYFPFANKRRVIAVRAFASLSDVAARHEVSFTVMPTIGGSDTVRSFQEYRFRDRNFLLFNAEYRWEVFSGLDMALFADAGQVYADVSDIRIDNLETAFGGGLRFNTSAGVFLRLDLGVGREGAVFFFKFGHVF